MSTPERTGPMAIGLGLGLENVSRMWGGRWGRLLFPGFWLVYLGSPINYIAVHQHGWRVIAGLVLIAAFAFTYLFALPMGWGGRANVFWPLYGLAIALTVGEGFFAHAQTVTLCVYLAVLTIASRTKAALGLIVALVAASALLPRVIPGWGGKIDWNTALTVGLVSIAMFGFFKIIQSNIALAAARAEVARLAAENERSRIARDLHDLLGHSLTTITIKAGLARRLAERGEADRSLTEIREVETLSRRTLADVRSAVAGHRDVTLAGELATSREVLRASGIITELPGSVDLVDPDLSETFGWVVREGITNVVRHSRATHCVITLGQRWIEITDDGHTGMNTSAGNGLTGLRERLSAVGGTLDAGGFLRGWRLRAEVPTVATVATVAQSPPHIASAVTITS
jgi:two-component system sensor histidine kinase DesK